MTGKQHDPDDIDTGDRAVPPYEDRRKSADMKHTPESSGHGARTGGATGPTDDSRMKARDPERTPGGRTASPADEKTADRTRRDQDERAERADDEGTGPSHHPGTRRAEDQP